MIQIHCRFNDPIALSMLQIRKHDYFGYLNFLKSIVALSHL
jgi:hypothetical protein